ncbi:MAG: hypothetical protein FWC21_02810 [Treponema sp.]|nr:hypothetical protein [Treponema sp.]
MKKILLLLLAIAIIGSGFVSCKRDSVSYCVFCSSSNIVEVSEFNLSTGLSEIHYECSNCNKSFGAGKLKPLL